MNGYDPGFAEVEGAVSADPRGLLEIGPRTVLTPELIRRHFNRVWQRLDPAKIANMGDDFIAMVHAKRAAVRAAALALIAPFREELEPKPESSAPGDIRENRDLDEVFGL